MRPPPRKPLPMGPPQQVPDHKIRKLALAGHNPSEIARRLHLSQNAVWLRIQTLGLPRNPRITSTLVDKVLRMYFNGIPATKIMWVTGLPSSTVRTILDTVRPQVKAATHARGGSRRTRKTPVPVSIDDLGGDRPA